MKRLAVPGLMLTGTVGPARTANQASAVRDTLLLRDRCRVSIL